MTTHKAARFNTLPYGGGALRRVIKNATVSATKISRMTDTPVR